MKNKYSCPFCYSYNTKEYLDSFSCICQDCKLVFLKEDSLKETVGYQKCHKYCPADEEAGGAIANCRKFRENMEG